MPPLVETHPDPGSESLRELGFEIDSRIDVAEHHKQVIEENFGYMLHIARDDRDTTQNELSSNDVAFEDLYDPSKPTLAIFAHDCLPGLELTAIAASAPVGKECAVPNIVLVPWLDKKDYFSHDGNRGYLALHNVTLVTAENTFAHFTLDEPLMADMTDRAGLGVEVLEELSNSDVQTLYTKEAWDTFEDKTSTQEVARLAGVRAAHSVEVLHIDAVEKTIEAFYEMAGENSGVVIKPLRGKTGDGVRLFDEISVEELADVVKKGIDQNGPLVLEERIRSMKLKLTPDGRRQDWNVRSIVAGKYLDMYARANVWGGPVNKAQGAAIMAVETLFEKLTDKHKDQKDLTGRLIAASNRIAEVLGDNVAGIDLTLDEAGEPVLIEVNVGNFGGIYTITQLYVEKMRKLAAPRLLLSLAMDRLNRLPNSNGHNTQSPVEVGYNNIDSALVKLRFLATQEDVSKKSTSLLLDKVVHQVQLNGEISHTKQISRWCDIVDLYNYLDEHVKAGDVIDSLTASYPDNHDVQKIAAKFSINSGVTTAKTKYIDVLISKNPFNTRLYTLKIAHFLNSGDIAGAIMSLKDGLEVDSDSGHLHYASAFIVYELLMTDVEQEDVDDELFEPGEENTRFERFKTLAYCIDKHMKEGLEAAQKYILPYLEVRLNNEDTAAFAEYQTAIHRLLHNLAITEGDSRLSRDSLAELADLNQSLYETEVTNLFTRKDIAKFKPGLARFAAELSLENGFFSYALLTYKHFSEGNTPPLHSYLLRRNIATSLLNKEAWSENQDTLEESLVQKTCQVIDLMAQEELAGAKTQIEKLISQIGKAHPGISSISLKTLLLTILVDLGDTTAINQLIPEIIDEEDNKFSMEIAMATDRLYAQDSTYFQV